MEPHRQTVSICSLSTELGVVEAIPYPNFYLAGADYSLGLPNCINEFIGVAKMKSTQKFRRFMGTETEFGIATPTQPKLSPIVTSTHAVVSYALRNIGTRSRWDFAAEHPTRDTRGSDRRRYRTGAMVDPETLGVANAVTHNGARFYVDHAHPEYSSPECADAWQAMVYDQAGDRIALQAINDVATFSQSGTSALANHGACPPLKIYKNNVDGKGASYGSHENYLYPRSTEFADIADGLIPFFVTRIIMIGAGRVGLGQHGETPGFQISQRADYIEQEISLETTLNRGLINTRDEPHTNPETHGRLHVITGDANMSQTSTLLKLGTTALVLDAIDAGVRFDDLRPKDPVSEISAVSHDLSLTHKITLANGSSATAIEIQKEYLRRVTEAVVSLTEREQKVLALWEEVLDLLADDPLSTAHLLDWTAKYALIKGFLDRGVAVSDPKIALIDLQYTDVDPSKSLYHALVRKGRMRTLVTDEEINMAIAMPPTQSRAWTRGRMIERFADELVAANWQELHFADPNSPGGEIFVDLTEVDGLNKAAAEDIIASSPSAAEAARKFLDTKSRT